MCILREKKDNVKKIIISIRLFIYIQILSTLGNISLTKIYRESYALLYSVRCINDDLTASHKVKASSLTLLFSWIIFWLMVFKRKFFRNKTSQKDI